MKYGRIQRYAGLLKNVQASQVYVSDANFVSRDKVGDPNRQDRRILPSREQIQTHDSLYFACSWSQL